jgi:hypothetical protein
MSPRRAHGRYDKSFDKRRLEIIMYMMIRLRRKTCLLVAIALCSSRYDIDAYDFGGLGKQCVRHLLVDASESWLAIE